MEALGVLPIHQLDELQAVGVVPAEPLRQLPSGVPAARADAAIIQLIGQHHIQGPDARAVLKKVAQLLQVDAPLHIEHQQAQLLRHLRRGRHRCADLRLRKLGDHGHHRLLRLVVQQRTQALALRIGDTLHKCPSSLCSGGAGGADHQLRLEQVRCRPPVPLNLAQQPLHGDASLLKFMLRNSGQMDTGNGGVGDVVIPHQGQVLRHPDPPLFRRLQNSEGGQV